MECALSFYELFEKDVWREGGYIKDKNDGTGRGIRYYCGAYLTTSKTNQTLIEDRSFTKYLFDLDNESHAENIPVPCYLEFKFESPTETEYKEVQFTLDSIKNPLALVEFNLFRVDEISSKGITIHNQLPSKIVKSFFTTKKSELIIKIIFERLQVLDPIHINSFTQDFYSYRFKKIIIWKLNPQ